MDDKTNGHVGSGGGDGGDGNGAGGRDFDGGPDLEPDPYGIIGVGKRGWRFFATVAETGRLTNRVGRDEQAVAIGDLDSIFASMIDDLITFRIGLRAKRRELLTREDSQPGRKP